MHKIGIIYLFALILFTGCLNCQAQVYAVGFTGGPMVVVRVDEHKWTVGSWIRLRF